MTPDLRERENRIKNSGSMLDNPQLSKQVFKHDKGLPPVDSHG